MFWVRLRSSIILMIFTISFLLIGGNVLFGAILVISLIGLTELYKIVNINKSVLGAVGYLGCILFNFIILSKKEQYIMPFIIGFLLVLLMAYVFQFPKYQIEHVTVAFFGLFYVAIMLSYVYQVRMLNGGAFLVWLIFIGAWGSDTCAYCVGMTLGKHKFLPLLSPKKSLEGCIGGVVGAALLGFLYAIILNMNNFTIVNSYNFAIICGASSIISQLGDLAASAIKRNHNIKDYGTLIPGHGGILDRFDSIIFVAPIVFYLSELL